MNKKWKQNNISFLSPYSYTKSKDSTKAFTLVELVVVITILAVLATISFLALNSYNEYARNTVRTADLSTISRWIKLKIAEWGYAPKPENSTTLTASWTTIGYQWEFSKKIWSKYWINWNLIDPLDERNYVYSVDENLYRFTVWWFLEWDEVALGQPQGTPLQNSYAAEWRTLKTTWDKFWIILKDWKAINKDTWLEDNELDIVNTDEEFSIYFDDNELITWTWVVLSKMNPRSSCERILELGNARKGVKLDWSYDIQPNKDKFEVYCDMTSGWVTDFMKWEWSFAWGQWMSTESWSSLGNEIVQIETPIPSWYAVHQTWASTSEYEIHFEDVSQCKPWYELKMSAWVSDEDWWIGVFHHRMYYSLPHSMGDAWSLNWANLGPLPIPNIINTRKVNWRVWELHEVKWIIPKQLYWFSWYIWYAAENPKDLYFTWVRLSCLPK